MLKFLWDIIQRIYKKFFDKEDRAMPGNKQENHLNVGNVSGDLNLNYAPQQNITNIHNHRPSKEKYPEGSIGADEYAHAYIVYLAKRAAEAQVKSGIKATPQKFYTKFEREHGQTPLLSRMEKFEIAVAFLQNAIDRTRFARGMKHKFYHSFEDHKQIIDNPKGKKGLHD